MILRAMPRDELKETIMKETNIAILEKWLKVAAIVTAVEQFEESM